MTRPTTILMLGNSTSTANSGVDTDSRITMYGKGSSFTNIFPNSNRTSGSNAVYLPVSAGTIPVYKASTTDIGAGANLATDTLYLVYE